MVVTLVGFVGGWITQIFGVESQLASAFEGASVATFFTFLPSFIYIFIGAFVETTYGNLKIQRFTNASGFVATINVTEKLTKLSAFPPDIHFPDIGTKI